jgi:hypothetical protein
LTNNVNLASASNTGLITSNKVTANNSFDWFP